MRSTPRTAGFALVEVVVALGVMAIGLALASRLLIESQLGLVRVNAELGNPLPRYALTLLRSDLEQAAPIPPLAAVWRSSPLILTLPSGERVAWVRTEAEAIERVILDAAGQPSVRHVVLSSVAAWRWRPASDRLIDVEITYRARDTSGVPLADVPRTWSPPTVDRVAWLRAGMRAQP
jgi:type II secretory pathway component PulJ